MTPFERSFSTCKLSENHNIFNIGSTEFKYGSWKRLHNLPDMNFVAHRRRQVQSARGALVSVTSAPVHSRTHPPLQGVSISRTPHTDWLTIEAQYVLLSVVDLHGIHGWQTVEADEPESEVITVHKTCDRGKVAITLVVDDSYFILKTKFECFLLLYTKWQRIWISLWPLVTMCVSCIHGNSLCDFSSM